MLTDNFVTMEIGKAKHIALVAHDGKKKELIEWCDRNKEVLQGHFLCGTGTTARLIAEKTGPHFAVGDTCYSHCEETEVHNPDGKEIVAKYDERGDKAVGNIERFAFYEEAKTAYCIISTSEKALYANIMLQKGVVINN